MPTLFNTRFVQADIEYELDLNVDDAAIMDDALAIEVTARRRPVGGSGGWQEETLRAEFDWEEQEVRIKRRDVLVHTFDIRRLMEIENPDHTPDGDLFDEGVGELSEAVETCITAFPTDPFVGCLLKAGLSTAIGQAIRCYGSRDAELDWRGTTRHVFSCLKRNGLRMLGVAGRRVLFCSLSLGLA